jgi:hypothetical protein
LNTIVYFLDDLAALYKDRKILNLTLHEEGFEVPAEWPFFAILLGKSACDMLWGIIKTGSKGEPACPYTDQIMTARQLIVWA